MRSFLYEISVHLLALLALPHFFYRLIFKSKYRTNTIKRFGIGFPKIERDGRKLVWIHAPSVGETKAVSKLAKSLKERGFVLVVSTITETGHADGKKSIPDADYHVYLPFDFSYVVSPIVSKVKPDLVLLCETDFWYNFLKASKSCGAKIALVNGKLSEKSLKRYNFFRKFFDSLFSMIDCFCVQGEEYKKRFMCLGIPECKIQITGNLKLEAEFDRLSEEERESFARELGIKGDDFVIVFGSTHSPEEELFLDTLENIWKSNPKIKAIIVPRHPERFSDVENIFKKRGYSYVKFSELKGDSSKLILIDAMGKLQMCYQVADLAVVAGSYTPKVGGHNILEPVRYGVPVLYGPYMYSQPGLVDLANAFDAGRQVLERDLQGKIDYLIKDSEARKKMGASGYKLFESAKGSTKRTLQVLEID